MGLATLNPARYGNLLAATQPRVIQSEKEHRRLLAKLAELDFDKRKLSEEEVALAELLATLVTDYEERHYKIPDAPPHRVLRFLMEQRGLRQAGLATLVGSRSLVSEIVNGKRGISKAVAKKLAAYFHVSADLFL